MQSVNPATGETFATYEDHTTEQVQAAVAAAHAAYGTYRRTSFEQRSEWMNAAADILERRVDELALLATREMGKTLEAARQEVLKCASACRYYAEHAGAFLASYLANGDARSAAEFATHISAWVIGRAGARPAVDEAIRHIVQRFIPY